MTNADNAILTKLTTMRKKYWSLNGKTPKELHIGETRLRELINEVDSFQSPHFFTPDELYQDEDLGYVYGMRIMRHEKKEGLMIK